MRNFVILGLTGPTGAGKSTFCTHLVQNGFFLIDADKLAREALLPGSSCVSQLRLVFGEDIQGQDGQINRGLLASRAFSSSENTQLLNDITHPWIFLRSLKLIKEKINEGERLFVFDAPVLFESNSDLMCDLIACVMVDRETRLSRIMSRDKISREAAQLRLSAQHSDSFYTSQSDFIIDGMGDEEYLSDMALMIKRRALSLKGGD